jgi:hypothetical protein
VRARAERIVNHASETATAEIRWNPDSTGSILTGPIATESMTNQKAPRPAREKALAGRVLAGCRIFADAMLLFETTKKKGQAR